ncbi:hypothetical protein FOMPIDRAFT_1050502 [Fomitopsis schrenkii]|uniref:Uncharacterized protein n=1 Tax=Fomitopsis schrenkii TaxID=2126942 RepID=S8E2S4_FOMSC|nr:hypothetical protein FOMPIDRAFT_1050502 [Fomitopsis schrenkii]
MPSSSSSSDTADSRRSDGPLNSSDETAPVDELDHVQEIVVPPRVYDRSSSPSPSPSPRAHLLSGSGSSVDFPDRDSAPGTPAPSRPLSLSPTFVSSPLNPNHAPAPRPRRSSRGNTLGLGPIQRVASEEAHTLSDSRSGSMILYRLASEEFDSTDLPSPPRPREPRASIASDSGSSLISLSYDSKYPAGSTASTLRGFVPYAYDPAQEEKDAGPEDDDDLYEPAYGHDAPWWRLVGCRGIFNVAMLVAVIGSLLTLFVCYPVVSFYRNDTLEHIAKDSHINSTGQYQQSFQTNLNLDARRYPLHVLQDRP